MSLLFHTILSPGFYVMFSELSLMACNVDQQLRKTLALHATSTNNLTSYCWFIDNASQLDTWECKECAESFQSVRICYSHRCFCQRCGSSLSFFLQFSTSRQIKFCKHYTKSNAFTSRTNIGTKEEMKFRQPHGTCNLASVPPRYFER